MGPNPQETADLVTFTEEILNEKPLFFAVPLKKSRKVKQCHPKSLISVLACFWSANVKNLLLQGKLGTGLCPLAVSDFSGYFLIS